MYKSWLFDNVNNISFTFERFFIVNSFILNVYLFFPNQNLDTDVSIVACTDTLNLQVLDATKFERRQQSTT